MVAQEKREFDKVRRHYQLALQIKIEYGDRYSYTSTYVACEPTIPTDKIVEFLQSVCPFPILKSNNEHRHVRSQGQLLFE